MSGGSGGVTRPAQSAQIGEDVGATAAAWSDVVDLVGGLSAVLTDVTVTGEDDAPNPGPARMHGVSAEPRSGVMFKAVAALVGEVPAARDAAWLPGLVRHEHPSGSIPTTQRRATPRLLAISRSEYLVRLFLESSIRITAWRLDLGCLRGVAVAVQREPWSTVDVPLG